MLRDYLTEERVKGRVTSTTTENIAAQILLCDRLLQDLVTRCIYEVELQDRITRYNDRVHLHGRIT